MHVVSKVVVYCLVVGLFGGLSSVTAVAGQNTNTPGVETDESEADRPVRAQRQRLGPSPSGAKSPYRHLRDHRGFFRLSPVVAIPGIFGDIDVGDNGGAVDADPLGNLQNIDLTLGAAVEVGYRNFSITGDFRYFDVASDQIDVDNDARVGLEQFVSNVTANWRYQPVGFLTVGPVAGIRHVHTRAGVSATGNDRDTSTEHWLDPIVGLSGRLSFLADRVFIPFYGDVGGVGIGSELTWQAYGGVGLALNRTELELGVRALYIDYDGQQVDYDVLQAGPTLTTTFRF